MRIINDYKIRSLSRSDYWSADVVYKLLCMYSAMLVVYSVVLVRGYWLSSPRVVSLRVPFFATLLFGVNVLSHYYGYNLNLYHINYEKLRRSLAISLGLSLPIYMFLAYAYIKAEYTRTNITTYSGNVHDGKASSNGKQKRVTFVV